MHKSVKIILERYQEFEINCSSHCLCFLQFSSLVSSASICIPYLSQCCIWTSLVHYILFLLKTVFFFSLNSAVPLPSCTLILHMQQIMLVSVLFNSCTAVLSAHISLPCSIRACTHASYSLLSTQRNKKPHCSSYSMQNFYSPNFDLGYHAFRMRPSSTVDKQSATSLQLWGFYFIGALKDHNSCASTPDNDFVHSSTSLWLHYNICCVSPRDHTEYAKQYFIWFLFYLFPVWTSFPLN